MWNQTVSGHFLILRDGFTGRCQIQSKSTTCHKHEMEKKPGPKVIKHFSFSAQLSIKIFLLTNLWFKLRFMSRKNSILSLSEPAKCWISWYFHIYGHIKFQAQLSWAWKKFYYFGACKVNRRQTKGQESAFCQQMSARLFKIAYTRSKANRRTANNDNMRNHNKSTAFEWFGTFCVDWQ